MRVPIVILCVFIGALFGGQLKAQAAEHPHPQPTTMPVGVAMRAHDAKTRSLEVEIEKRLIADSYRGRWPQIQAEIIRARKYHGEGR